MKIVRRAKPADLDQIVDLAVESVSRDPIPVEIDRDAMRSMVADCISPMHFCWVTEVDGRVEGAVVAQVVPGFWFRKFQCSVLMYYSRVRGGTWPLLIELARWIKDRAGIKMAVMELEPGTDARVIKMLSRLGFSRQSTNMVYVRGLT